MQIVIECCGCVQWADRKEEGRVEHIHTVLKTMAYNLTRRNTHTRARTQTQGAASSIVREMAEMRARREREHGVAPLEEQLEVADADAAAAPANVDGAAKKAKVAETAGARTADAAVHGTDSATTRPEVFGVVADEDWLPLAPESCDLIVSCMGLHWLNDAPRFLSAVRKALRPEGVMVGACLGGDTLAELRHCIDQVAGTAGLPAGGPVIPGGERAPLSSVVSRGRGVFFCLVCLI
jgi:SAM-dependent methyltransferase